MKLIYFFLKDVILLKFANKTRHDMLEIIALPILSNYFLVYPKSIFAVIKTMFAECYMPF